LEELLYWGAILAFYLWSAYRSNQKKAQQIKPQQAPLKKELDNPQIPNNSKINILDFLNEAFEEQSKAISLQNTVDRSSKKGDQSIKDSSKNHFDNNQDLSVIDDRHLENHKIKDQHLDMIKSRLNHKQVLTKSKKNNSTLVQVQKKYTNNPTKLGILMQAIFEPPKAMQ
jgi:hypothetical protein